MSDPRETPAVVDEQQATIRRAPKVPVFLVLGALLGVIGALVSTVAFEVDPLVGATATFGYLCVYFIPAGLLLGALVALFFDARSKRRARPATLAHETVHEAPVESAAEGADAAVTPAGEAPSSDTPASDTPPSSAAGTSH